MSSIRALDVKLTLDSTSFEANTRKVNKAVADLDKQFDKLVQSNPKLANSYKGLSTQMDVLKKKQEHYKTLLTSLNASHQKASDQVKKYELKKRELNNTIEKTKSKMKLLVAQGKQNSASYTTLQAKLAKYESDLVGVTLKEESWNNKLNKTKATIDGTKGKIASLDTQIAKLGGSLNTASMKLQSMGEKTVAFGQKMKSVSSSLASVGRTLTTRVTVPLVGIGAMATKTGIAFEASMSNVQAISGATGDKLQQLENKAKELGKSTVFSSSQVADAFGYMSLAGYEVEEMLEAIEPMLDLAKSGNLELSRTSDLVTDSLSALGLETSDLDVFLDQVAKTASTTNTSIDQLMTAYIETGGMARTLKIDTAELSGALGVLANSGYKG